jgi:hypothetical protein
MVLGLFVLCFCFGRHSFGFGGVNGAAALVFCGSCYLWTCLMCLGLAVAGGQ